MQSSKRKFYQAFSLYGLCRFDRFPLAIFFAMLFGIAGNLSADKTKAFDHNHTAFDKILKEHVVSGKVNYKKLKKNKPALDRYLKELSLVSNAEFQNFGKNQQLAFLINAYNAFTLDLVIKHYPVKSIGDIGGPIRMVNLARGTPWKKFTFPLLGSQRNLDWIEHGKLRVDYREPRIHFAINCASIGCPLLLKESFKPGKMDSMLNQALVGFLKEKKKNRYDAKTNTLYLSKIFDWFREDFEKKSGSVLKYVQKAYPGTKIPDSAKIKYTDYDWNLNDAR